MNIKNKAGIPARITAVYRDRYEFVCDKGTGLAVLKTGEYYSGEEKFPTTGDYVLLDWQRDGESRVLKTLPRKTFFSRLDPSSSGHGEQAVAANFDYVFIMQSIDRDFNLRRLERYLALAWQSGAMPVVILTKADGGQDYSAYFLSAEQLAIGVEVIAVSAKTGFGLEKLEPYFKPDTTIVFLGSSGVGKSSLVNALAGKKITETASTRQKDCKGRHTTTCRQLITLENGAMIIDTPGMRELGMWDVTEGLGQSFSDVEQYLGHCKFSNCRHQSEPGCAIKEAIRTGELSQERWESYMKLSLEAKFSEDKAGYLQAKEQWHKDISKLIKEIRKAD